MPVTWRIDGVVLLESDPEATFQEWTIAVDAALADSAYRPAMGLVHDARRLGHTPSATEARDRVYFLVQRAREKGPSRWAVLVSSEPAQYGMGRMAEALSAVAQLPFRVFKDLEPALAWARGDTESPTA